MATHKSAIKRHGQSLIRRERNNAVESAIKTETKKVKEAVAGGKSEDARKLLAGVTVLLDRAVSKGTLHRNNASRKISRLTKSVNAASSQ